MARAGAADHGESSVVEPGWMGKWVEGTQGWHLGLWKWVKVGLVQW